MREKSGLTKWLIAFLIFFIFLTIINFVNYNKKMDECFALEDKIVPIPYDNNKAVYDVLAETSRQKWEICLDSEYDYLTASHIDFGFSIVLLFMFLLSNKLDKLNQESKTK